MDDGSTDTSPQKCDYYAQQDDRFVVIHQKNQGPSVARNAGTNIASGDYIIYYDVDDDISSLLLEDNMKLAVENDADVVMFCFSYYNMDTDESIENSINEGFVGDNEQFFHNYLNKSIDHEVFNAPWNKLYKLKFLKENDLYFLQEYRPIYEDTIFAARMLKVAKKIVVNNNTYYTYYVRSSGSLLTKYVDGYFDSVSKFYSCALGYCRQYEDNQRQVVRFTNMYVGMVTTNLKQISCRKELSFGEKRRKISEICGNDLFRQAVAISELEPRKNLIKGLILHRLSVLIIVMYLIIKKLEDINWRK